MRDYFLFGGCLRSELSIPELPGSGGRAPDWTLSLGRLAEDDSAEVLSDSQLSSTCHIRLTRGKGSLRYAHSCTGTFDVSANGRTIIFEPSARCDFNAARTDLVARVMLLCVDRGGVAWLHGSAVRIGHSAVAFLGQSGVGKSTLALALARAGADHICDDTLPVEPSPYPTVWPSDHVIRLRPDSRDHLASTANALRRESDGKYLLTRNASDLLDPAVGSSLPGGSRTPLSAIYLIEPSSVLDSTDAVTRRPIAPTAAVPALIQHIKLGPVVRPEDPARMMQQLGAIAGVIPVFGLSVARDWGLIDEVVTQIFAWHSPLEVFPSVEVPILA